MAQEAPTDPSGIERPLVEDLFDDLPEPSAAGERPLEAKKGLLPGHKTSVTEQKVRPKFGSDPTALKAPPPPPPGRAVAPTVTLPVPLPGRGAAPPGRAPAPPPQRSPPPPLPPKDDTQPPARARSAGPPPPPAAARPPPATRPTASAALSRESFRSQETISGAHRVLEGSEVADLLGPDSATNARGAEATLVIADGPDRGTYALHQGEVVIGRGKGCDIRVVRGSVSRAHASIDRRDGKFVLRDLGSKTGTFINNLRAEGDEFLHDDDEIRFGQLECKVMGPGLLPRRGTTPSLFGPKVFLGPATVVRARPELTGEHRRSSRRWWILGGVAAATFVVALGALVLLNFLA